MTGAANTRKLAAIISRQPEWLAASIIGLAALWLHFFFLLHVGGFWRDEVNLINLANSGSLTGMSKDAFPILMPVLVRGWTAIGLGHNDISLRMFGILTGLSLLAALWIATWRIKRSPPLLGLALLAVNSSFIMFGDSMRAYGLGSLAILLAAAAACLFLEKPTWPRAGWLAALAILSVQVLYQNAFLVAAISLGAWAVCWRQKNGNAALKIFAVAAISAASLLPYWSRIVSMPAAAAALRTGLEPGLVLINLDKAMGFPMQQYTWIWEFLVILVAVGALATLLRQKPKHGGIQEDHLPLIGRSTLAVALAAAVGFIWFAASPKTHWWFLPVLVLLVAALDSEYLFKPFLQRPTANAKPQPGISSINNDAAENLPLFAGVTLLTAIVFFACFLRYAALITEPWYFLPLMVMTALCSEIGLPRGRHTRAAIFGFVIFTLLEGISPTCSILDGRFTNIDLVAHRVAAEAGPDDFIVVTPWYCGITFDYYYRGPARWDTLPPLKDHSTHRYDLVREQMETRNAIGPVLAHMAITLQAGHRVWIVGMPDIPKSNAPPVTEPGPPPLKNSGWSDRPYNLFWSAQAAFFLKQHSRQFAPVYYTTNENIAPENLRLGMAEGWQQGIAHEPVSNSAITNAP